MDFFTGASNFTVKLDFLHGFSNFHFHLPSPASAPAWPTTTGPRVIPHDLSRFVRFSFDFCSLLSVFPLTVMHPLHECTTNHSLAKCQSRVCFLLHYIDQGELHESAQEHKQPFLSKQVPIFSPTVRILFSFIRSISFNFHRPWCVRGTSGY